MLRFFNHLAKQFEFSKVFKEAVNLSKSGDKEAAFNKFTFLLKEHPANPYVRHQVSLLGEELNKPVDLPKLGVPMRYGK